MTLEAGFAEFTANDPTWRTARDIVQAYLNPPSSSFQLIRQSWLGAPEPREFIRMLGFSRMSIGCLLDAAGLLNENQAPTAATIEQALQTLGMRYCAIVLAINFACQNVFSRKTPTLWKRLFQEMMTWVEIGYRFGAKASSLGLEGGALMGFSRFAGNLVLMAAEPDAYKKWSLNPKPDIGFTLNIFGCEPYQVSAFALQRLGFGHEVAIGAALGNGKMNPRFLNVDERTVVWKATLLWIEALREGRNYPASTEMRHIFPELAPPRDGHTKNPNLEALYAEVAKTKGEGSSWTWHLPKPGYDLTAAWLAEKK